MRFRRYVYHYWTILAVLAITSCSDESAKVGEGAKSAVEKRPISKSRNFAVDDWQPVFGVQPETISIDASVSNTIELAGERSIRIPAYSLIAKNGSPVSEAEVSYFYVGSIDDAIACGLSTLDDEGRSLVSDGMFYLDARSREGDPLEIAEGSAILFSLPSQYKTSNQGVYYGVSQEDSSIVWEKSNRPGEEVIAFEAKELYPDDYWLNVPEEYYELNDPAYNYTNLATLAVRERLRRSEDLNHYLDWIWKEIRPNDPITLGNNFILNTYKNNLDKPIYYSDSIVVNMCKRVLDSCEQYSEKYCPHEKDVRSIMGVYQGFYDQRLGQPIDLQKYMEVFESADPMAEFEAMGIDKGRAGYLIDVYNRYKEDLKVLRDKKEASKLVNEFSIERLGWANIDKLYTGGIMKYPKVKVRISGAPEGAEYRAVITVEDARVMTPLPIKDSEVTMNMAEEKFGFDQFDKAILYVWAVTSGDRYRGELPLSVYEDGEYEIELKLMGE